MIFCMIPGTLADNLRKNIRRFVSISELIWDKSDYDDCITIFYSS